MKLVSICCVVVQTLRLLQVSELEKMFGMLDADVNGLLMTGPPVALDELYQAQSDAQAALSDQASHLQVGTSSLASIRL